MLGHDVHLFGVDVHLFGVEPLTNAHSFGDVFEPDENFFEDGFTRRSAKRSQAVQPPLERRGISGPPPKVFSVGQSHATSQAGRKIK